MSKPIRSWSGHLVCVNQIKSWWCRMLCPLICRPCDEVLRCLQRGLSSSLGVLLLGQLGMAGPCLRLILEAAAHGNEEYSNTDRMCQLCHHDVTGFFSFAAQILLSITSWFSGRSSFPMTDRSWRGSHGFGRDLSSSSSRLDSRTARLFYIKILSDY